MKNSTNTQRKTGINYLLILILLTTISYSVGYFHAMKEAHYAVDRLLQEQVMNK